MDPLVQMGHQVLQVPQVHQEFPGSKVLKVRQVHLEQRDHKDLRDLVVLMALEDCLEHQVGLVLQGFQVPLVRKVHW